MKTSLSAGALACRRILFSACALVVLAAVGALDATAAQGGRPPAVVPTDPETVLERLPRGYSALVPDDAGAGDRRIDPATEAAHLLSTAAATGDARLASRAEALLSGRPADTRDTRVLGARAFAAQHRHDFATAIRLLDRAIAIDPRDGASRAARAQVHLVQGDLAAARSDCVALALGIDAREGALCVAALAVRRGDTAGAARLLDRWLGETGDDDPLRRHVLVMRAEVASQAGDASADAWFARARAVSPDDVRTLAAQVRHLRAHGRDREALALLADGPDTDALHLQRALAAHALRAPGSADLVAAQARRYALAHRLGSTPELRDEGEFMLTLRNDPQGALALASRNFASQRDAEDVDLLQRAAAAGRLDALGPLQAWATREGLALGPPAGRP